MKIQYFFVVIFCFIIATITLAQTSTNNLHLIDENPQTGFGIYRYSKPTLEDMKKLCKLGITEVMVLSGTAQNHEYKDQHVCPNLKVIYNVKQISVVPLSSEFLNYFDSWVKEAKLKGKKIAFRCECGCHRTGRLAAYYEMKYKNYPLFNSLINMYRIGQRMYMHPELLPQVSDIFNYIHNLPCRQGVLFCVRR